MVFFTQRARPALCAPEQTVKSELTPIDLGWAAELNELEWLEFLAGVRKIQGHVPPKLPSFQVQRMFVRSDGMTAFQEAALFLRRVKEILCAAGSLPSGSFFQVSAAPPYSFETGKFDLILIILRLLASERRFISVHDR